MKHRFAVGLPAVCIVTACASYDSPKALMAGTSTSQGFCYQIPASVVRDRLAGYLEKYYGTGRPQNGVPGGNRFVSFMDRLQIFEEDSSGSYQISLKGTSGTAFVANVTGKTDSCVSQAYLYGKATPWYGLFREIDSAIRSDHD